MSLHPSSAARNAGRDSRVPQRRANRVTMWPSPFQQQQQTHDEENNMIWPGQFRNTQRWTSTFDAEALASRMSLYVGDGLLPQSQQRVPDKWTGQPHQQNSRRGDRATWMQSVLRDYEEDSVPIWEGNFDVEKRDSFVSRPSGMSERSWYRETIDPEKFDYRKPREPLTEEQLGQADKAGGLVTKEVLMYDFPGEGTLDDPYMVSWIENDPANPLNFTKGKKWLNAMILAIAVWTVSIASSGFSQGQYYLSVPFHSCMKLTNIYRHPGYQDRL